MAGKLGDQGESQSRASAEFRVGKTKDVFDIHRDYLSISQAARSANHRIPSLPLPRRDKERKESGKAKRRKEARKRESNAEKELTLADGRRERDQNPSERKIREKGRKGRREDFEEPGHADGCAAAGRRRPRTRERGWAWPSHISLS